MNPPMTCNRGERKSIIMTIQQSTATSQSTPSSYSPTEDKVIIPSPISNEGHMVIYEPSVLTTPEDIIDNGSKLIQFNEINNPKDIRKGGFDHCYVKVPAKDRLAVLFATLRRSTERKVIIIFSTWQSCKFHAIIFKQLEMCKVYELHEKTEDVKSAYKDFLYHYPGILFTSAVSMSQFDIPPNTDYVIQYEPLINNPTEYIYRLSNTKLYHTSSHKALLFINPDEINILKYFKKINTEELEGRKSQQFQTQIEKLVNKHIELNGYLRNALKAFVLAYKDNPHTDIYDHTKLDNDALRQSFGQQSNNTEGQETEKNETEKKETERTWRERNSMKKPPMEVGGVTQLNISGLTISWRRRSTKERGWRSKESKKSKKPWIERDQKKHAHKVVGK